MMELGRNGDTIIVNPGGDTVILQESEIVIVVERGSQGPPGPKGERGDDAGFDVLPEGGTYGDVLTRAVVGSTWTPPGELQMVDPTLWFENALV